MYSTQDVKYGRRFLIAIAALVSTVVQVYHAGPPLLTIATIALQLGAIFFGGAPGTLSWLILSRKPAQLPQRRTWDGSMHLFIAVSLAIYLGLAKHLSDQYLGCTGGLLLLSYGCAKQGCYRLGCCGWTSDPTKLSMFSALRTRVELQKLEALLSFVTGACLMVAAAGGSSPQSLFFVGLVAHMGLRQLFVAVRSPNS